MDFSRTLTEIILFFLSTLMIFILLNCIGIIAVFLFIQDSLIFIYKQIKELLWQKKQ